MEIYLGTDHRGFAMKEGLVAWLTELGHNITDVGAHEMQEGDDYPDYAKLVAEKVAEDSENSRGILLCGSGVGMEITANKVAGIRAGNIQSVDVAKSARNDDDINVLALGADILTLESAQAITTTFLTTPFSGMDRHVERIKKITEMDK